MDNNNYTQDYQKIIFVNNLEETPQVKSNILRKKDGDDHYKYDFSVFFTGLPINSSDNAYNYDENNSYNTELKNNVFNWPAEWGDEILNIWYKGQRLNRFIGVNKENSTVSLGNHSVKLKFDYKTGLLALTDLNKLQSMSFVSCNYTNIGGTAVNITNANTMYNYTISAKDNKFSLTFKYILDEPFNYQSEPNDIRIPGNINNITKNIIYGCGNNLSLPNAIRLEKYFVANSNAANNELNVTYHFIILYDTDITYNNASNNDNYKYTFISEYDASKSVSFDKLRFRLNPINFDIYDNEIGGYITNKTFNDLTTDTNVTYTIHFSPNLGEQYSYAEDYGNITRRLYFTVESSNTNAVTVPVSTIYIDNAYKEFALTVKPMNENTDASSTITIKLFSKENNGTAVQLCTIKTFTIKTVGRVNKYLYYYGYVIPTTISQMKSYENFKKNALLYDWKNNDLTDDTSKYFYVAIPIFDTQTINAKWDSYIISNLSENKETYNNMSNSWNALFTKQNDITIRNMTFALYKLDAKGLFFGKIQKDY